MPARATAALLILIIAFGGWLRLPRPIDRTYVGSDEGFCAAYVTALDNSGLRGWPQLIARYIEDEKHGRKTVGKDTVLPPTRILFLGSAHLVRELTDCESLEALRRISWAASIATLLLGAVFVSRLGLWKRRPAASTPLQSDEGVASTTSPAATLAVTAFLACSPLLIHLAHRALIDGFFALTALLAVWGLWESLRAPNDRRWLALYAAALIAMVITKENAAFAYAALLGIVALNRWLRIGTVTRPLLLVTFAAPALGAGLLILAAGGLAPLLEAYRLNATKSVLLPYALKTGDGPWHRYILDFLLVSPAITLLAIAALGGTRWSDPAKRHLALFLLISYACMAQVRYGMNMRYGAMWALPLCWLAYSLLAAFAEKLAPRFRTAALTSTVLLVCATELHSYRKLFVAGHIYDPVPGALAMPLQMWKPNQ